MFQVVNTSFCYAWELFGMVALCSNPNPWHSIGLRHLNLPSPAFSLTPLPCEYSTPPTCRPWYSLMSTQVMKVFTKQGHETCIQQLGGSVGLNFRIDARIQAKDGSRATSLVSQSKMQSIHNCSRNTSHSLDHTFPITFSLLHTKQSNGMPTAGPFFPTLSHQNNFLGVIKQHLYGFQININ